MNAPLDPTHHPVVDAGPLEALWAAWHDETARFFVPAFLGKHAERFTVDWSFRNRELTRGTWCVFHVDGDIVDAESYSALRTAHENLALKSHEDAFFDGLQALVSALVQACPTAVREAHTQVLFRKGGVAVGFVFDTNGTSIARYVRAPGDITPLVNILQQDTPA